MVVYNNINTDKKQKPDNCNPDTGVFPLRIAQRLKISNSVTFQKDNAPNPSANYKPFTDFSWVSTL